MKADYDISRLVEGTMAFLRPDTPVIVRIAKNLVNHFGVQGKGIAPLRSKG